MWLRELYTTDRSRLVLLCGVFLVLVITLPVVPANWATLSHSKLVAENYSDPMAGGFPVTPDYTYATTATLTISGCSRGALILNWDCYGYIDGSRMQLANDFQWHRNGADIDVNMELRGHPHRVYHWGLRQAALAFSCMLGFLIIGVSLVAAAFRRFPFGLPLALLVVGSVFLIPSLMQYA